MQYINIKLNSIKLHPDIGCRIQHSTISWQDFNNREIDFTVIKLNIFAIVSIAAADITVIQNQRPIVDNTTFIPTNRCKSAIAMNKVYETINTFHQLKKFIGVLYISKEKIWVNVGRDI